VLGVGVALVAVVGVLLGLVVGRQPSTPSTARAAAGSTPLLAGVPGQLDVANRTASIAAARMALPDEPYVVRADPLPLSGPIEECFLASAQVHPNYDGHHDWSAMVGLAHVRPSPGSPADLEVAATAVLQQFAGHFFDGSPTTVSKPTLVDHPVDGRPGVLLSARVGYRIRHLPSRYDAVRVVVVQVDNGSTVAAFSSVPSDAPSQLERLATDSLRSLQVG